MCLYCTQWTLRLSLQESTAPSQQWQQPAAPPQGGADDTSSIVPPITPLRTTTPSAADAATASPPCAGVNTGGPSFLWMQQKPVYPSGLAGLGSSTNAVAQALQMLQSQMQLAGVPAGTVPVQPTAQPATQQTGGQGK
jgi:hypothetical protein